MGFGHNLILYDSNYFCSYTLQLMLRFCEGSTRLKLKSSRLDKVWVLLIPQTLVLVCTFTYVAEYVMLTRQDTSSSS